MESTRRERERDHISSLPDEILCNNILSRLYTETAIQTSILSSRWRHLWKYIPSLIFYDHNWERETDSGFISRSIDLYRAQRLTEFKVTTMIHRLSIPPIEKWVDFAASRSVQVLRLELCISDDFFDYDDREFEIAPSIYSAQSLEKLCLGGINFNPPLGFCGFRNLKKLEFSYGRVRDEIVHTIVSTCELLEELRLIKCYGLVKCVIATRNMNLTNLWFDVNEKFELVIDVPNLQFFYYKGMPGPIRLNEFGGFANIRHIFPWDSWEQFDIMKELANVKVLEVGIWFIMLLMTLHDDWGAGVSSVLPFGKLERLFLHGCRCKKTEVKLLVAFLGICPCLHEIQLNFSGPCKFFEQEDENVPEVCVSNLHQLRYIGVFNFIVGECEMELLQLLLDKAVMLETICFTFGEPRHGNEPDETLVNALEQHVALLHRTSVHSRVLFKRGLETWRMRQEGTGVEDFLMKD